MRDPRRIDRMIEHLRAIWHSHPDLRLGQLVESLNKTAADIFYVEDDHMEARLGHVRYHGWAASWPPGDPAEQEGI